MPSPDVLFIGPGIRGSRGESEVRYLPSFTRATCTLPVFPHGYYWGYVSTLSPDGPLLCGGRHSGGRYQSSCYLLARNGSWVTSPQMKEARGWAAAVQMEEGWWVTGNIGNINSYNISFVKTNGLFVKLI